MAEQKRIQSARMQNRANSFGALNLEAINPSSPPIHGGVGQTNDQRLLQIDNDQYKMRTTSMNRIVSVNPITSRIMSPSSQNNLMIQMQSDQTSNNLTNTGLNTERADLDLGIIN